MYWNDTSKAFESAANETEKKFQDEVSNLEIIEMVKTILNSNL